MDAATRETGVQEQYFRPIPSTAGGPESPAVRKAVFEQSRRQQLADRTFNSASDTVKAVAAVRAFDRTGHALDALGHLIANAEATLSSARELAADICQRAGNPTEARWGTTAEPRTAPPATPLMVAQAEFNRSARRPNA